MLLAGYKSIGVTRDMDRNFPASFPAQRIEDDNRFFFRNSSALCSVDCLGDCIERTARNLIRRPAHHVVVLLRILIDDSNPRTRSQVMELVEEHPLPILGQFSTRIRSLPRLSSQDPCKRSPLLRVEHLHFGIAHVLLV